MALRDYYTITKPGIIYGNLFTAVGAFFLGAHWHLDPQLLVAMIVGLGLIIASAGVINNYFDRDIDAAMERTRGRASVTGAISPRAMLIYGTVLGILGAVILFVLVNREACAAALFGLFAYLALYTLLSKRGSEWGTLIGSISGAMPPVVGYVAATGAYDATSALLFLMLAFWQMPHAYAIALYRYDDYKAANIPVLPVSRGIPRTKIEMLTFVILFSIAAPYLTRLGSAGNIYLGISLLLGLFWFALSVYGFTAPDTKKWGRQMFLASLIVLMALFVAMALDSTL